MTKHKYNRAKVKEGIRLNSFFYQGLGYRIAEDYDDFEALADTVKELKEKMRKELIKEIIKELKKKY